ncbi:MAG: helix-turn-helix domain-containing protein [Pseudomonadota bacterium]
MAKRKSMKDDPCPVARALEVIGDRWAMLIVRDAYDGSRRFGDFQRNLGVARNILTDRLHGLTEDGILAVQPASDGSAYQEYVLTEKGEQLFPVVLALRQWGEQHLFRRGEKHSLLLEKDGGAALPPMLPHSRDGRVLRAADTVVKKLPPKDRPAR